MLLYRTSVRVLREVYYPLNDLDYSYKVDTI